ncbi:MAG: sensor histidine kinase, partial [Halobacteriaceae archaeon]
FVLVRITVLPFIEIDVSLWHFIIGQAVPLTFGLALMVGGISLGVSTLPRYYVNTITIWSFLATAGMGIVDGFILLQVSLYQSSLITLGNIWITNMLANTLIAGSVGGALIGFHSAEHKQQRRDLSRTSNQLTVLTRLLRHEVLNKITIIKGYANSLSGMEAENRTDSIEQIVTSADHIQTTIEDVGFLTRLHSMNDLPVGSIPLAEVLDDEITTIREIHPDVSFTVNDRTTNENDNCVLADSHLHTVFEELLQNAIRHNDGSDPQITIDIRSQPTNVRISITDNGPGLPDDQREILERGNLPDTDDPTTGFGIPVVRMIISQYNGTISVKEPTAFSEGTTIVL